MILGRICVIVVLAFSLKKSLGKEQAVKTAWGENYAQTTERTSTPSVPASPSQETKVPDQILDSNEPVARAQEGKIEKDALEQKAKAPVSKALDQTTPTPPVVKSDIFEQHVTESMPEVNPKVKPNKFCEEHVRNMKLVLDPILLNRLVAIGVLTLLLVVSLIILSCVLGCVCNKSFSLYACAFLEDICCHEKDSFPVPDTLSDRDYYSRSIVRGQARAESYGSREMTSTRKSIQGETTTANTSLMNDNFAPLVVKKKPRKPKPVPDVVIPVGPDEGTTEADVEQEDVNGIEKA